MGKILRVLFCFIVVDFFFFSTSFTFSYGYNTKELLAVIGIVLYLMDMYRQRKFVFSSELLGLLLLSVIVSLLAVFSSVYHNTQERAYTTFFISMLVWVSGAFTVIKCVKGIHGKISIELLSQYIVAVSVVQGLIAVIADFYAPLDNFIYRTIPGVTWCRIVDRLYGFGETATFDTGGIRFAIASVLCAHNIRILVQNNRPQGIPIYVLAFLIIGATGNMVARTTLVGVIVGIAYLLIYVSPFKRVLSRSAILSWIWFVLGTLVIVIITIALYNSNEQFYKRTRFAFEGFFSLVETGHWETGSNDRLAGMYVFPDNPETWLIGDGYFINPSDDPNYLGEITAGFYKDTDVGYLRFIYFFGLLGLAVYSLYIIYAGRVCNRLLPGNTLLFICLTSMNFIVWLKVATDCFFILGLFICLGYVNGLQEKTEVIEE